MALSVEILSTSVRDHSICLKFMILLSDTTRGPSTENIKRIYYECEGRIEKSIPRITV